MEYNAADQHPDNLAAEIARIWADRSPNLTDIDALADALVQHCDHLGRWVDRGQARADALAMIVGAITGSRAGTLAVSALNRPPPQCAPTVGAAVDYGRRPPHASGQEGASREK